MSKVPSATQSLTAEIEMTQQSDIRPTMAAKGQSWQIPYEGRSAKLELTQSIFGKTVIAALDGVEVSRWAAPTGDRPWAEHQLPDAEHEIVVALISARDDPFVMRVFVDGKDLDDGTSLESWRSRPRPRDQFEKAFGGWWFFDWYGPIAFGLAVASPVFIGALSGRSVALAVATPLVAVAGFVYFSAIALLVKWLIGKIEWPVMLRTAIFWFALIGSFAAVVLLLGALPGPH